MYGCSTIHLTGLLLVEDMGHSKPFTVKNDAVLNNLLGMSLCTRGIYLQDKFLEAEFLGERICVFVISKIIGDCPSLMLYLSHWYFSQSGWCGHFPCTLFRSHIPSQTSVSAIPPFWNLLSLLVPLL